MLANSARTREFKDAPVITIASSPGCEKLSNEGQEMKWILVYSSLLFLILRSKLKLPYDKYYSEDGFASASFRPSFSKYLENIKQEVKIRLDPSLMSWREPHYRFFHPDNPANWRHVLVTPTDKLARALAHLSLVACAIVFVDAVRSAYIHQPWGNIPNLLDIVVLLAVLPPSVWLRKQSYVDGATQGYLNGYMDGYEKGYRDAKIEDGEITVANE